MDTVTSNSVTYKIINRSESGDARKIDEACKNKWKWSWLEEKDVNGDYLSAYVRKINVSGSAFCIYCNKTLVYGNTGKKDLLKHATKSTEHLSNKKNYLSTTILPLHWRKPTRDSSNEISTCPPLARECTMPYGVAENVHTTATCPSLKQNTSQPIVSMSDRINHVEAYILSFAAENSLPLSTVPKLIEFSQFLARDPKALSQLQMNRTAATYKLKHGLSVYVCKKCSRLYEKISF